MLSREDAQYHNRKTREEKKKWRNQPQAMSGEDGTCMCCSTGRAMTHLLVPHYHSTGGAFLWL